MVRITRLGLRLNENFLGLLFFLGKFYVFKKNINICLFKPEPNLVVVCKKEGLARFLLHSLFKLLDCVNKKYLLKRALNIKGESANVFRNCPDLNSIVEHLSDYPWFLLINLLRFHENIITPFDPRFNENFKS